MSIFNGLNGPIRLKT